MIVIRYNLKNGVNDEPWCPILPTTFPGRLVLASDFARIKQSGLDTIQLWVVWAWVKTKPGQFNFNDYDRLVDLAGRHGLNVVLSTIAEVHPYWIHRAVPGSEIG